MRILHILNDLRSNGNGIVHVTVDLACEQVRQGHEVAIVSKGGHFADLVLKHGVQVYALDQARSVRVLILALWKLRRLIREFRPDLIHAHMRTGLILAWLCTRFMKVPLVVHLHNVHDRHHGFMRLADRVIAVSQAVQVDLISQGVPSQKVRVVVNGPLGSPRRSPTALLGAKKLNHPAIVTVAGMNHRKGIAELIQAFCIVAQGIPEANLYLVGHGPERALFENLASRSQFADQIHFEGYQDEPAEYMLASDIFVLASRRESISLVLMEAREVGCAIIATAVDGIPEALANGQAGLLVPPNNPTLLAESIDRLLRDDKLRRVMRQKAQEGWQGFSCDRMAKGVETVYRELLSTFSKDAAPEQLLLADLENNNVIGNLNR